MKKKPRFKVGDRVGVRWSMWTDPPHWRMGEIVYVGACYRIEFDISPGFHYNVSFADALTEEEMKVEQVTVALGGPRPNVARGLAATGLRKPIK